MTNPTMIHLNPGSIWYAHIIAMIGTSDQSCWLAEACKILLLLLLLHATKL